MGHTEPREEIVDDNNDDVCNRERRIIGAHCERRLQRVGVCRQSEQYNERVAHQRVRHEHWHNVHLYYAEEHCPNCAGAGSDCGGVMTCA